MSAINLQDIPKHHQEVQINGMRVDGNGLMALLYTIFNPNPERWYRFERKGDTLLVEEKIWQPKK